MPPPEQAPAGPTLDKLSTDIQALGKQIKQVLDRPGSDVAAIPPILTGLTILLAGLIGWQWYRDASRAKEDDKDLEALRIIYGFWLIVAALFVAKRASTTCLIMADHNRYSIDARAAGRMVLVRSFALSNIIPSFPGASARHRRKLLAL